MWPENHWNFEINRNTEKLKWNLSTFNGLKKEVEQKTINSEVAELLNKEALINEAKILIYEKCGINNDQNKNSVFDNFSKWFIDEAVLWNYDMAIEIINTNWKIIFDALSQLVSWEGLKKMAEALWESIYAIWDWDAYEKWKAIAELWLVTTGLWATAVIWKKWLKLWIKQISKLRVNKETLVESLEVKKVILDTTSKIDEIVPKKVFDLESVVETELPKKTVNKSEKSLEADKTDILEMWWTYKLDEIKWMKVIDAKKKLETFSESIDVKYLVNNPARIDDMLDIVESMCYYIDNNIDNILKLNKQELLDFKDSFSLLKNNLWRLLNDNKLAQTYKIDIQEIFKTNIKDWFYKLHPNLAAKKNKNELA